MTLLLSERFHKVKPLEKTDPTQQNYLVVEVAERKNWSGANNGATCYTYTKWKQTDDGFVYTQPKGSRKLFDSIEKAFKAGGIGKPKGGLPGSSGFKVKMGRKRPKTGRYAKK